MCPSCDQLNIYPCSLAAPLNEMSHEVFSFYHSQGGSSKQGRRKEVGREGGREKILKHVQIMSTMLECSSDAVFGTTCSERSVIQGTLSTNAAK